MQLTQLQDAVIEKAHGEGHVNPDAMVRLLRHDLDDVQATIRDLLDRGVLESAEGGTYRLTDQGQAAHRAREKAESDAVKMDTRTWQPR